MAAPTIRGSVIPAIVTNGDVSITSPSSTAVGDLCIFFLWTQGADSTTITHTVKSTFFEWFQHAHEDGSTDGRLSACVKKATGAGAVSYTPFNIANGTANQSSLGMIVLTAGTYSANLDTALPRLGTAITGTGNQAPDCPVVPASGTLTGDYLILAVAAWHVTTAGSTQGTAGANYTIEIQNANASHVTHLAVKRRARDGLSAATEDPPAYTDNVAPNGTARQTIAIKSLVEHTTSVAADGGGTFTIAASTREIPAGVTAFDGGGTFVIADATVSGGAVEHTTSVAIDGGSSLVVGSPTRETFTVSATDGGSALTIASPVRETATSTMTDGVSGIVVGNPAREMFSATVSAGAGSFAIADATVSGPSVEHLTSVDLGGAGLLAVADATVVQPHSPTPCECDLEAIRWMIRRGY